MNETAPKRAVEQHEAGPDSVDFAVLAEHLPALLAVVDTRERYLYVNRAYEDFFGTNRSNILTRTIREVVGQEKYAVAEVYITRALTGESVSFVATATGPNGSVRDLEVSYTPQHDNAGQVTGFVSLTRDVTGRSFDDEARARLAAIVDSSDDAIVSKTLQGVITSWNRSAERMFGYTAAEAIGNHITLIIPPDRRSEEDDVLARLRRGEKIDHFETERRAKDGHTVYVSLCVSPVRNAAGQIIGASKVARDITERKRAEEELRANEEYRRAVLESMPECVKVLDRDGTVMHMNPAGLRMLEATSSEDVVGKCVYPLIKKEDREAFRAINENVFSGGSGGRLEFSARGLKGSERIFETNVVPLRGATKTVVGALSVTRDITSRKQSELRDAFLLRLDDATRQLSDPAEITNTAARLLTEHLGADRCVFADIDSGAETLYVTGNYACNVPGIIGRYTLAAFGQEFLRLVKSGRTYVIEDVEAEAGSSDALQMFRTMQTRAAAVAPLVKLGRLVAVVAVHQATPRKWRPDEIDLVQLLANRCWESIERARIERELRESEQQFRNLANSIPHLAWMAHADGYVFWYNRRWYEYTGTTPEQMEGWGWEKAHDTGALPAVLERWRYSIATGQPFEMVFPLKGADGQFREFLTRVEPVKDHRDRVVRWFGTNTDVSAQQETERREKRARETAEVLNRVGPVLAAELDPEKLAQKITDIATEAVRAEFGAFFHNVRDEAGESYTLYTLSGVPREAFARFPMPRNTHIFGPTFRGEDPVRSDDITKDPRYGKNPPYSGMPEGHLPVRSYLAVPVKSRTGEVFGGLFFGHSQVAVFSAEAETIATGIAAQAAIALDNAALFSETRHSSEALRRTNEELTRLNEDLNQFAYSASHDLREPLRMVSIYTQFLSRKLSGQLDPEGERFIEHVLKGASRLEALIRDLLAYTKAAETTSLKPACSDAGQALKMAISNLSVAIREAGANITVLTPNLPKLALMEVHVIQLFQNLIGNAVKYRSEDPPQISVKALRRGHQWEFSVSDNGIGVEEQYKEHIFGIFKRLHNNDEYSGTGIGLAICQRIVQRHEGQIWVESQPGRGSTFFFTLPAAD